MSWSLVFWINNNLINSWSYVLAASSDLNSYNMCMWCSVMSWTNLVSTLNKTKASVSDDKVQFRFLLLITSKGKSQEILANLTYTGCFTKLHKPLWLPIDFYWFSNIIITIQNYFRVLLMEYTQKNTKYCFCSFTKQKDITNFPKGNDKRTACPAPSKLMRFWMLTCCSWYWSFSEPQIYL